MSATEIIAELREQNFIVKVDGDYLKLSPSEKITDNLIQRLKEHKPAIIEELKREQRRNRVLKMLEERPEIQRAFLTDNESVPDNVILTMAIRGMASFEMLIPKHKYDPFMLLELISKGGIQ